MERIEWGLMIVNYLFMGGLSAGLYFVSGLATYLEPRTTGAGRLCGGAAAGGFCAANFPALICS